MSFAYDLRHWRTHEDFRAHLAAHDPAVCSWVTKVVIHHTVKPTIAEWRGEVTMNGMRRYYEGLGWDSGPHLFVVAGSLNAEHDGIWQMTPLHMRGIHANRCNPISIGIEVVGYYDRVGWSYRTADLTLHTIAHFLRWRNLTADVVVGHRDCPGANKTCPGSAIQLPTVRQDLRFVMSRTS